MASLSSRYTRQLLFFAAADGSSGTVNLNGANLNPNPTSTLINGSFASSDLANSGSVDFYQMLDQPADAPTIQLRNRINEVYAEAQANRDHRNPERRRHFATLLGWIPQARLVLLHEGRRAKYDAYVAQARLGQAPEDFRTYLNELVGEADLDLGEGESILGLRDLAEILSTPATARLSPRLDAIRAAAGEAAAKANAAVAAAVMTAAVLAANRDSPLQNTEGSPETQNRTGMRRPTHDEIMAGVGDDGVKMVSPAPRSAPRGSVKAKLRHYPNPESQKERAALLSSAAGFATGLLVLLTARALLPDVHFIDNFVSAVRPLGVRRRMAFAVGQELRPGRRLRRFRGQRRGSHSWQILRHGGRNCTGRFHSGAGLVRLQFGFDFWCGGRRKFAHRCHRGHDNDGQRGRRLCDHDVHVSAICAKASPILPWSPTVFWPDWWRLPRLRLLSARVSAYSLAPSAGLSCAGRFRFST